MTEKQKTNDRTPPALYAQTLAHIEEITRSIVNDGYDLKPAAFLLHNGLLGDMISGEFDNVASKDKFTETVRQRASARKADAIVFVSEVWSLPPEWSTPERYAEFFKLYKQIADAPFKIEQLMLTVETYDGVWLGRSAITGTGPTRTFGPIEWADIGIVDGRFTKLLPVRYATPAQVSTFLESMRANLDQAGVDPNFQLPSGLTLIEQLAAHVRQAPADKHWRG